MKKVISFIAAVTMACTAMATSVFAHSTTSVVIKSTTEKLTNEDFYDLYDEDIPTGKDAYLVSFDVTGLKDSLKYTKDGGTIKKPTYGGTCLDNMEIILRSDDDINCIDTTYSYIVNHALASDPNEGFGKKLWSTNYAGNLIYPAAADTEGVTSESTTDYLQMCFVIDAGETVSFETEGTVSLITYSASYITSQTDFTNVNGATTLSFSPATIEIGSSTPASEDFKFTVGGVEGPVAGTEVKNGEDTVIGIVWKGCKLENLDTATNDYVAKFTADGESGDRKTNLKFGTGIETSGDVTFDAVMYFTGAAKTNVKMNVVEQAKD